MNASTAPSPLRPPSPVAVRAIAIVEATKGALALLIGLWLLSLIHSNVQTVAAQLVRFGRFDPADRYPRAFLDAAGHVTDTHLWVLAFFAFVYAAIRAVEVYGLWQARPWAEWFALGSTAFYLPAEIYELRQGMTWSIVAVLIVNVTMVFYLANVLRRLTARSNESADGDLASASSLD